jgi:prepilin-type N-terminal cleavage/methylation domain-containing protein
MFAVNDTPEGGLASQRSRPCRPQRGFSLIEVLAALLVLAVVITTTMAMFVDRQKRMQNANETILAYQSIANEIEVRRRIPYDQLETAATTFITDTTILKPLAPYAAAVAVSPAKDYVKTVTMSVRWRNGQRVERVSITRVDTGGGGLW